MVKKIIPGLKDLPFSKAIVHNQEYSMEISGQIGLNPKTSILEVGIDAQTRRVLDNIIEILAEVGWNLDNLIKVRIFLADIKDYDVVNEIYSGYFVGNYPTRVALAVKDLPLDAVIEIDCTAAGDKITD